MFLVQDANCQTDTPVGSDDDNTIGADDSAYGSTTLPDTINVSISSPTAHQTSPSYSSPSNSNNYSNGLIHRSYDGDSNANASPEPNMPVETDKMAENSFETTVSSTNMVEDEPQSTDADTDSPASNASQMSPKPSLLMSDQTICESVTFTTTTENATPDISGLVLLTKSIEAMEKKNPIIIKQEVIQAAQHNAPIIYQTQQIYSMDSPRHSNDDVRRASIEEHYDARPTEYVEHISPIQTPLMKASSFDENLGGLNLLCALAEQHFQNEVCSSPATPPSPPPPLTPTSSHCEERMERKRSQSTDGSEPKRSKKHKEKHSNKKSKKKDRKEKKRRLNELDDGVARDFRDTFDHIKDKYLKCDCRKAAMGELCQCKVKFPTIEEVYSAMNVEMRNQLAHIKRRVKEEERKLDAISNKDQKQAPYAELSPVKSADSLAKLPFSSAVRSTWPLTTSPNNVVEFASSGKMQSDSESSSSTSSKRKLANDTLEFTSKKSKSLVGYIFASKKRLQNDSTGEDSNLTSDTSPLQRNKSMKHEIYDFDDNVTHPEVRLFGSFSGTDNSRSKNHLSSAINEKATTILKPSALSKHNKQKDKNDEKKKQQRTTNEQRECKRHIDRVCMLTADHLDSLADGKNQRVLTAMGGLFYAGHLKAVRAPDLYGVTLDGERGNKAHIMSREDILRDAVSCMSIAGFADGFGRRIFVESCRHGTHLGNPSSGYSI